MFSVPDGRTAHHPFFVTIFRPPMEAPLPGAFVKAASILSPASVSDGSDSFVRLVIFAFCSAVAGESIRS